MKILMLRHSAGFEHSFLPNAEVALKNLGRENGWDVTTTHRCDRINEENMAELDMFVSAISGNPPLSDGQRTLLIDFVKGGKGFVGIHNATTVSYDDWPEYVEMVGGDFIGHPWHQEVVVNVENADHPATRMLGKSFKVHDEIYTFAHFDRNRTNVLMSLDNDSVDISKGEREDGDYALGWCHNYGRGRVIYTALGHPDVLWEQSWFLEHITGGIRWAAKLED